MGCTHGYTRKRRYATCRVPVLRTRDFVDAPLDGDVFNNRQTRAGQSPTKIIAAGQSPAATVIGHTGA